MIKCTGMSKPTAIVLQARTGSTRLPRKMLMHFYGDKSIPRLIVERIRSAYPDRDVVIATSESQGDDRIEELAEQLNIKCVRGSEDDVLERFLKVTSEYGYDKIVRVCADNPFLDMDYLGILITELENSQVDYTSFSMPDGRPTILTHYGFWAEGTTAEALGRVKELTGEKVYREHVTNYIYKHPQEFKMKLIPVPDSIVSHPDIRLTIDTAADFSTAAEIYAGVLEMSGRVSIDSVIDFLDHHPEFYERMREQIDLNKK